MVRFALALALIACQVPQTQAHAPAAELETTEPMVAVLPETAEPTVAASSVSPTATCASSVGPGIAPPASVPAGIPGFHAAWYGQSGYMSLCPGARETATLAYYNSGSRGWAAGVMGQAAYLGTWEHDPGQDRATILGGDGTNGSPNTAWPRYNRIAEQPHEWVAPGQVAWFQFGVQAPSLPGIYRLYVRPLVEGATWMEDHGVYWQIVVLNPDGTAPSPTVRSSAVPSPISFHESPLAPGTLENAALGEGGGVVLTVATAGSWTSPWHEPPSRFTRLIPSWNADTPPGTWIEVEVQASGGAVQTPWYRLGRWAYGDGDVQRTSFAGQSDAHARVDVDTVVFSSPMARYRMRALLFRSPGSAATPDLRRAMAVTSDLRGWEHRIPSPHSGAAIELAVPRYSQETHTGHYPEYDGGGESWCSPTSTAMVLAYWGTGPSAADLAWIDPAHADRFVDHAARHTYDAAYGGTGNWTFNAAYAARFGLRAFVTQLRSVAEAQAFLAAGIPLVVSISMGRGELPGFLFDQGTNGHLLVIVGVTASGDVIANDPAALSNGTVPRIYPRAAFERAWLNGSGGITYVIHPADRALPATVSSQANW